jgi:hypothetical protein
MRPFRYGGSIDMGEMMKNLSRIRAVIEVLELYAKGGITEIYLGNGQFMQVNFVLKEPAASEEIHLFKQETGWELPEDLEEFLIHHNGARLLMILNIMEDQKSSLSTISSCIRTGICLNLKRCIRLFIYVAGLYVWTLSW